MVIRTKLGKYGAIPPLIAAVGGWSGGLFSDWLVRRGKSLTVARKVPIILGMLGSSTIAVAAIAPTSFSAMAWLSVSYASLAFAAAGVWALPSDVAPTASHVGSLGGIQNFASNAAGIVLAPLVGWPLDVTHNNYLVPLALAGIVGVVGALIYAFVVGPIEPLPTKAIDPFPAKTDAPLHAGSRSRAPKLPHTPAEISS